MQVEVTGADEVRDFFVDREISYELGPGEGRGKLEAEVEVIRPDLVITRASSLGVAMARTERMVRKSAVDEITLWVNSGLPGRLVQDGRQLVTPTGSGVFYSSLQPMELYGPVSPDPSSSYEQLMIQVDRAQLRRVTGHDLPLGTQVPADNVGLALLGVTATRLLSVGGGLSTDEREHFGRALLDLFAAVVISSRTGRPVTPAGPEALIEQLKADVFARLDDPDLGPADLAARHNISLRYVHRLFGAEAPAAFIRRHRMLAAADLVARPSRQPLPVSGIAIRCGFRDVGTFVRAFRRYYGCTPTDYRRLELARPAAGGS